MSRTKNTDITEATKGPITPIDEINEPSDIEVVAESMFKDVVELEKFMNEILTICVHKDPTEGGYKTVSPEVGGIPQPILRGANSKVKRKYVEALARTKTETFQQVENPTDRSKSALHSTMVPTYPFSIINDPNPKGRAWIEGIMAERR